MNEIVQLWLEKVKGVFAKTFIFVMGAFFVLTFIFIFVGLIVWVAKLVFKIDVSDWFQACENLFLAEHRVGIFDILIMCAIAVVISLIVSFVFSLVYAIVLAVKKNLKL